MKLDQRFSSSSSMTSQFVDNCIYDALRDGYFRLMTHCLIHFQSTRTSLVAKSANSDEADWNLPNPNPYASVDESLPLDFSHRFGQTEVDKEVVKGFTTLLIPSIRIQSNALCKLHCMGSLVKHVVNYSCRADILARLIEVFSGNDRCGIFNKRDFFDPLGIADTGYNPLQEQQPHGNLHSYNEEKLIKSSSSKLGHQVISFLAGRKCLI